MQWYYWFLIVYFIGVIWLIYQWIKAPKGYEDATGFHYGKQKGENDEN